MRHPPLHLGFWEKVSLLDTLFRGLASRRLAPDSKVMLLTPRGRQTHTVERWIYLLGPKR